MNDTLGEIKRGLLHLHETRVDPRLAAAENVQIQDLARISDGWETEVYRFVVESGPAARRAREDRILRIYPGEGTAQKSAHEYNVMQQLYAAGYPVPRVLHLDAEGALLSRPFVIMERIVGRSLGAIVADLPRERRREHMARFCRMFVDLHALDWRPFAPDPALLEGESSSGLLVRQLSDWQTFFHTRGISFFDPVFDWLRARLPGVRSGPPSLLHWDFHYYNILIREADGAAFVIDWAGAMVADHRIDLAWTLLLMSGYGWPEARALILEQYEGAAGQRVDSIEVFEALAATRRLFDISSALLVGAAQAGLRPGAEAMMKNAAHIEYVYALLRARTGLAIPEVERLLSSLE